MALPALVVFLSIVAFPMQEAEPYASLLGQTACHVGDLDGDGIEDWAASAPQAFDTSGVQTGALVFFSGATDRPFRTVYGKKNQGYFGWGLQHAGDLDGDGLDEVMVEGTTLLSGADGRVLVTHPQGWRVAGWMHDLTGDGAPDLLVRSGKDLTGLLTLEGGGHRKVPVPMTLPSVTPWKQGVSHAGDLNGDGLVEVVRIQSGQVEVLEVGGNDPAAAPVLTPAWTIGLPVPAEEVRFAELDEKEGLDLVAYSTSSGWGTKGRVAGVARSGALLWLLEPDEEEFAAAVLVIGDVNGDGSDDIAIGSPGAYFDSSVRIVSGLDGGTLWRHDGGPLDEIGNSLDLLPDRNGDGVLELLVGGGCHNAHGRWHPTGNVHILSGADGAVLFRLDEADMPELRRSQDSSPEHR